MFTSCGHEESTANNLKSTLTYTCYYYNNNESNMISKMVYAEGKFLESKRHAKMILENTIWMQMNILSLAPAKIITC